MRSLKPWGITLYIILGILYLRSIIYQGNEGVVFAVNVPLAVANQRHLFHASRPAKSKFAYVTVHYEGTSRDAEYVLGIQVLMQSIKLSETPHDLVVLASDSVSTKTKKLFHTIGCRVIDVNNIANPFIGSTLLNSNFIYTLNKLHVWNLLDYDRVVYLDADNILIRNADELFLCGKFCAVFMNPCHFHTGLLVITPDEVEYQRLLAAVNHVASFDGADQGFLSSMYSAELMKAQLFKPSEKLLNPSTSEPVGMRLSVGYNINHKYFYEQYHWKLFYLRQFASMTSPVSERKVIVESARGIPAVTVGYPMAPVLKPWYWWAAFIMDLHYVWQDIRATLPAQYEHYGAVKAINSLIGFSSVLFICTVLLYALRNLLPLRKIQLFCSSMVNGPRSNKADYSFYVVRIFIVFFCAYVAPRGIHPLTPPAYGFMLFILRNVTLLGFAVACISNFWNSNLSASTFPMPPVFQLREFWRDLLITIILEGTIVLVSRASIFSNVLWRIIALLILIGVCGVWQIRFVSLSLKCEHSHVKERSRSL